MVSKPARCHQPRNTGGIPQPIGGCQRVVVGERIGPGAVKAPHSHSIVPGGLLVMSYTTRFTPFTSLTMRLEIVSSRS